MIEFRDIAAIITAFSAFLSVIASLANRKKIDLLHLQINSRMDEWINLTRTSALAEGRLEAADQKRKEEANSNHKTQ